MSGFWGTHREEAWHRRKEKEYERESAIRREGEQTMAHVKAIHNQELEQKEGILDIARGLIRDARHDAACAKKKKRSNSSSGNSNVVASLKDDDDGQEETQQEDDDGDENVEACRKLKRVKLKEEVVSAAAVGVNFDMNNDRQPDAVLSSDLQDVKGVAAKLPDDEDEPLKPDEPMDTSHVDIKLLPESIKSGVPVPDAAASSSSMLMSKEEKEAEENVRENLLALSYAMFDTLYGCRSFQPKSFVQFLVNTGERGLAEEIALAAIEKSHGSQEHVKFALDELVPTSQDPNQLVESISDILGKQSGAASVGGKDYLAQWHLQKGNSDQAFAAALLMKSSVDTRKSEVDILTHALPLTTTALRRQELKAACPWLLNKNVIGVFTDEEWPDFMSSLIPFTPNHYGSYDPQPESYLMFASSSKMQAPRNVVIATYYVEKVINLGIRHIKDMRSRPISGASYRNPHNANALIQEFVSIKTNMHDSTKTSISNLDSKFSNDAVRAALEKIGLDFKQEVIQRIGKEVVLPPVNECLSKHKNNMIALKCTKCKKAHMELAANLGLVQALQEHPTLAAQAPMIRQTYGLPYAPEVAIARVVANHFDPEVVAALLGNNPAIYCKQMSTAGT